MFDPYRVYERKTVKSHKGQIIQKKPVALTGSVSMKDLPLLKNYAKSLGYQLLPLDYQPPSPPPPPPPPPQLIGSKFYITNIGRRYMQSSQFFSLSLYNIRQEMTGTEDFLNIADEYAQRISEIYIIMTLNSYSQIAADQNNRVSFSTRILNYSNINYNVDPGEIYVLANTFSDSNATYRRAYFLQIAPGTYIGDNRRILESPPPEPIGPNGQNVIEYSGDNAIEFYLDFKNSNQNVLSAINILSVTNTGTSTDLFVHDFNVSVFIYANFR